MLAMVLVTLLVVGILWRVSAFVLAVLSWVVLALVVLSLLVGVPVPTTAVAGTVALWLGSQIASRLRRGQWRSMVLRGVARTVDALHSAV